MPAADDLVKIVTNVTSATYGRTDAHPFTRAVNASDHVIGVTPAAAGAAPARLVATTLLIATVMSVTTSPANASADRVISFAVRYVHRPVPCVRTDRRVPEP